MKAMRYFGDPVIRIIGFKPNSALAFEHNVKPANFIYPDEANYVGSTRTFAALHNKLVTSKKIGIAWSIPRRNAAPQIVAMVPSLEEVEDGVQMHPPGFFLIPLPFADDMRQNPEMKNVRGAFYWLHVFARPFSFCPRVLRLIYFFPQLPARWLIK
jgi:ATP-dependent DNA helicase 2 subunit 1